MTIGRLEDELKGAHDAYSISLNAVTDRKNEIEKNWLNLSEELKGAQDVSFLTYRYRSVLRICQLLFR